VESEVVVHPESTIDGGDREQLLRRRQIMTVGLMVLGYAGYYLCRSHYSVALPLLIADLRRQGMDPGYAKVRLGAIVSLGTLAYALGKPFAGGLADFLGGRRNFLLGMAGAIGFTVMFALGGALPIFTMAWFGNRLLQSLGWGGLIKITSRWFAASTYGTVMGILSLSFLFGDAAARAFLGTLIDLGLGWRGVFLVAAGVLSALFVVNVWLLRESPGELGLPEPPTTPANVYGEGGFEAKPPGLRELLAPLLRSPAFWLTCVLSLGLTLLRETFNNWVPTYFKEGVGLSPGRAAVMSALFPLFGGVSVLLAGFLGDRLGRGGRAMIILGGLLLAGGALMGLGGIDFGGSRTLPIALVALVAFLLLGPYSYLAGAIALDFGGKRGGATASGIIDFVGYLGGILAGEGVARLTLKYGWGGAFGVLAQIAWVSAAVAGVFLIDQLRNKGSRLAEKIAGDRLDVSELETTR
jgi:OPA family glycerol-3-phosphate transporter-like MFS transporter